MKVIDFNSQILVFELQRNQNKMKFDKNKHILQWDILFMKYYNKNKIGMIY